MQNLAQKSISSRALEMLCRKKFYLVPTTSYARDTIFSALPFTGSVGAYLSVVVQLPLVTDFRANKCSAVAEMGDRLATIDMGRKLEGYAPSGGAGWPCNTWRGLRPDVSSRLATIKMGRRLGGCAPFWRGELGPHLSQCGLD